MAVTNNGLTIKMTAANDTVTGKVKIQGAALDHTAAANAVIQDANGKELFTLRTSATVLRDWVEFPRGVIANGLKVTTLSAGAVTFYLASE